MKSKSIYALIMAGAITCVGTISANATKVENTDTNNSVVIAQTETPEWKSNSKYYVGDKVTYEGNVYVCIVDHSKLSPKMAYVWKLSDEVIIPEWKSNSKYYVGDKVTYKGEVYVCTVDHSKLSPKMAYVWRNI